MKGNPIEFLTTRCAHTDEHFTLGQLIGEWEFESDWYFEPGIATKIEGSMLNRPILGGHFIDSRCYYLGDERSRVTYGFDPSDGRFVAFSINRVTTRSDIEYGTFDSSANELRFSCLEFSGHKNKPMRADRTIIFRGADSYAMRIDYPCFEPKRRLGMEMKLRRIASTDRQLNPDAQLS